MLDHKITTSKQILDLANRVSRADFHTEARNLVIENKLLIERYNSREISHCFNLILTQDCGFKRSSTCQRIRKYVQYLDAEFAKIFKQMDELGL